MIGFSCSHCNHKLKVKDELAGKKAKCPRCGQVTVIPALSASGITHQVPGQGAGEEPSASLPTSAGPVRVPVSEAPTLRPPDGPSGAGLEPPKNARGDTLNDLAKSAGDATDSGVAGSSVDPALIDFLAPAEGPDELGRLGPYRVLKVLGAGGMGVVFQAEDPQLQRQVALKAMLPALATSPSAKKRFLREARAAAAIEHDHIVAIHQVGEDRGVPFLAMPMLKGEALEDRLHHDSKGGNGVPLPLAEVLRIGRETADGLAAAHERDLIHRDIKPANIWLETRPGGREASAPGFRVKILDFGLARSGDDKAQLTQQGAVVGTPAYMAPEQATGQKVDGRCDLFSLGCVLYRMSTGELPFQGTDTISTLLAVATETPRPPRDINPVLPPAFSDLVMRLLAKKPDERPPSARAVIEAIQKIEADSTAVESDALAPSRMKASQLPTANRPGGKPRRRLLLGGLVVGILAVGGVAVAILVNNSEPETKPGKIDEKKAGAKGQGKENGPGLAGAPLSRLALVSNPAPLEGVKSWSIEPRRHRGEIHALAYSPDSRWLASAGFDGTIRLWDAKTGQLVRALLGHTGRINALAWSLDRQKPVLASGGDDRTVRLWDGVTGLPLQICKDPKRPVLAVAWHNEKTVVARTAAPDNQIHFWDAETGKLQRSLTGPFTVKLTAFSWSPNGKMMATAHDDGSVKTWATDQGRPVQTLAKPAAIINCLAWSSDSKLVAGGDRSRMIHFWNAVTGTNLRPSLPGGFKDPPLVLAWAPDGKSVIGSGNHFDWLREWRLDTGKLGLLLKKPNGPIIALAWSPDGKTIAAGQLAGALFRWEASKGKGFPTVHPSSAGVAAVAWSSDSTRLANCQFGPIQIWDPATGGLSRTIGTAGNTRNATAMEWSPDDQMVATTTGGYWPVVWAAGSGAKISDLKGHTNAALSLIWSPDSKKVASTAAFHGQRLLIHEATNGKLVAASEGPEIYYVHHLAWSPDGKTLAGDNILWATGAKPLKRRPLKGFRGRILALAWSPRGTLLASTGNDKTVRLWSPAGEIVDKLQEHRANVKVLRWISEERLLSLDADGTLCSWKVGGHKPERIVEGLPGFGTISPDGRILASPLGNAVRLWDLEKGKPTGTLFMLSLGDINQWLGISADGHYRGSRLIEREIVYVVQTAAGQEALSPEEFGKKYGWKNDPERVRLIVK